MVCFSYNYESSLACRRMCLISSLYYIIVFIIHGAKHIKLKWIFLWKSVGWKDMAQHAEGRRAFVKALMNLQDP